MGTTTGIRARELLNTRDASQYDVAKGTLQLSAQTFFSSSKVWQKVIKLCNLLQKYTKGIFGCVSFGLLWYIFLQETWFLSKEMLKDIF